MALYTEISGDQMASLLRGLEEERLRKAKEQAAAERTRITNANKSDNGGLGGLLSNLTRDVKSAANTVNTTFSALFGSPVATAVNNIGMANSKNNSQKNLDAIAQKYGYKNKDDAYDKGDGPEEMWKEFQDSTNKTRKEQDQISNDYKNNAFVKKVNDTKQSQYGADALRTWTNLARAVAPTTAATIGGAGALGAVEGLADTLENANGTVFDIDARLNKNIRNSENATINAGDALKNAAIGATVGGVTAGVGGKLGNAKSNIGSKLLNNRVVTSGVGRGAIGGAVGGALGAGINAGIEGGNVLNAALQGAGSGALTGAAAGGLAGGARKVGGKVTDALGVTDKLNKIRGNLMYTPEEQPKAITKTQPKQAETEISDDGFRAYGDSELAKQTKKDKLADTIRRYGETLEGAQTNVTRRQAEKLGIEKTGRTVDQVRKRTGIGDIDTQAKLAKELTGGENSLLDNIQRRALSATEDGSNKFIANTDNLLSESEKIIRKNLSSLGEAAVEKEIADMRYGLSDKNSTLLDKANYYEGLVSDIKGKGQNKQTGDSARLKAYKEIAKTLEDRSYSAIPASNVDDMFNTGINEMRARAKQAQTLGNEKIANAYNQLATELENTPHTIPNFRKFKKNFVDAAKLDKLTLEAENGAAQNMGQSAGGIKKKVENVIFNRATNAGLAKAGAGLSNLADRIENGAANKAKTPTTAPVQRPVGQDMQNIYNLLGLRIGTNEGLDARSNAIKDREFANLESQLGATVADIQNNYEPEINYYTQPQSQTANLAEQLNTINTAMQNTLAAGDIATYNQLADLYKTAYNTYQMQAELAGTGKNSQTKLSKTQQQANAAALALDELENMNPDFGYKVKDIPGLNLMNLTGNKYASTADSLAMQIGYMLSGANIKEDEAKKIGSAYVPQPFDDEATRKYKLQQARNIIQQYQNTYVTDANNA